MKRLFVCALIILALSGCTGGNKNNIGNTLSNQDIKIMSTQTKQIEVENIIKFIYKSPTLSEFNEFIKDYELSDELLKTMRGIFVLIDEGARLPTEVSVIENGYYIDEKGENVDLYYDIVMRDRQGNMEAVVFVRSQKGVLTTIRGYPIQ